MAASHTDEPSNIKAVAIGAGSMVGKAAKEISKVYAGQTIVLAGRELCHSFALALARRGVFLRLFGNTWLGKRLMEKELRKTMRTPEYLAFEALVTGGLGYGLTLLPWVPDKAKPYILGGTKAMVTAQVGSVISIYSGPLMRKLVSAVMTAGELTAGEGEVNAES